jgi:hypothetical protein
LPLRSVECQDEARCNEQRGPHLRPIRFVMKSTDVESHGTPLARYYRRRKDEAPDGHISATGTLKGNMRTVPVTQNTIRREWNRGRRRKVTWCSASALVTKNHKRKLLEW